MPYEPLDYGRGVNLFAPKGRSWFVPAFATAFFSAFIAGTAAGYLAEDRYDDFPPMGLLAGVGVFVAVFIFVFAVVGFLLYVRKHAAPASR